MNLSISNIAWSSQDDPKVYDLMKKYGFSGLEIAPTRIFPEKPYDMDEEAALWSRNLNDEYGFVIPSMQSIWFGRQEKLFGTPDERKVLLDYTGKAVDFAAAIGCKNLVFGCPRNRSIPYGADKNTAVGFFRTTGNYAFEKGTVIGMEANPAIYNTNYINDTLSALDLIKSVDSEGFLLNLDVGTMIQNDEDVSVLKNNVHLINHVHISEPGLKPIEKRNIHMEFRKILAEEGYRGFVSVEMGKVDDIAVIESVMDYIADVFAD